MSSMDISICYIKCILWNEDINIFLKIHHFIAEYYVHIEQLMNNNKDRLASPPGMVTLE